MSVKQRHRHVAGEVLIVRLDRFGNNVALSASSTNPSSERRPSVFRVGERCNPDFLIVGSVSAFPSIAQAVKNPSINFSTLLIVFWWIRPVSFLLLGALGPFFGAIVGPIC